MFTIRFSRVSRRVSVLLITSLIAISSAQMGNFYGSSKKKKPNHDELTTIEQLGKFIFFDKISSPDNQSCAACHGTNVGFTGPDPAINKTGSVYPGAVHGRFGNRKPPSSAYATFSPILHYDIQQ